MQETQEMQVQSLGWEDPLEEEMATHSNTLAWRIPLTERGAWRATVHGVTKSRWSPQSMGCICTMTYSVSNTEESSETNVMNTNLPLTQRVFLKTKHGRYS